MNQEVRSRLKWIQLYQEIGKAGIVCLRCGISRPTLRKWLFRYSKQGIEGLQSLSRRPHKSPNRKVDEAHVELIQFLRNKRKLGARRIQSELLREKNLNLSLATIHKTLKRLDAKPLKRTRRSKRYNRYECSIPGERVQIDVFKVKPGLYQYTAVDDCTRYRVLGHYTRKNAISTLSFLEKVIEETPFPIQRIQTDRGREFFALCVQERLMSWGIKFRPIKPGSPHLNGKVERSQLTDLQEFYSSVDLDANDLTEQLGYWQHYYNWRRPHGSLGGKTPIERYCELSQETPYWEDVGKLYDPKKERIQEQNYQTDLTVCQLKQCL
jgi:transposase InsO family protein